MRAYTTDGITTIDQDDAVVKMANGVDLSTVNIASLRPNLDVLGGLFTKAYCSKKPEDAAAYVKHKARVMDLFYKRDVQGKTGE